MNELDSKARALLRATQFADEPSQDDYNRVHAAVTARIAVGVAVGAAVTTAAKTASAGAAGHAAATATSATVASTATVGATTAVATGMAGGGAALVGTSVAAPAMVAAGAGTAVGTSVVSALPVVKIVAWVLAASMTAGIGTGAVVVARSHPVASAPMAAPVVAAPPAEPSRPAAVKPRSEGQPLEAPVPVSDPVPSRADALLAAQPAASPLSSPQPSSRAETDRRAPVPAMSASMLEAEVALIRDARAALSRDDAAHALAILDDHARRFPSGAMSQDRDALQVFATCAAGQPEAARELASRFLSLHAGSPYAASVRASCVAQK